MDKKDEKEKYKSENLEKGGKKTFIVMIAISVLIAAAAIAIIFVYITYYQTDENKVIEPAFSTFSSFTIDTVNEESPQVLETDSSSLEIKPVGTPLGIWITSGVIMGICVIFMLVVKIMEFREER